MGNLNCQTCVEDLESNFKNQLKNAVISNKAILEAYNTLYESELPSFFNTIEVNSQILNSTNENIILIQHNWRKYKARQEYLKLKNSSLNSLYFAASDVKFTITKRFFTNNRKKRVINYQNGGIYEGETRGGFRDGYGKISWPDRSCYQGNWSFGYPSGYGKFVFLGKDTFEGNWINPFPYSKQSISSSTKSFDDGPVCSDGYGII